MADFNCLSKGSYLPPDPISAAIAGERDLFLDPRTSPRLSLTLEPDEMSAPPLVQPIIEYTASHMRGQARPEMAHIDYRSRNVKELCSKYFALAARLPFM